MSDRTRPPGPKGSPLSGCAREIGADRVGFMVELQRTYGDVVCFKVWDRTLYLVSDPDLIKDVFVTNHKNFTKSRALQLAKFIFGEGLLTNEGESHRRQRRMMQPAFHMQRIHGYGETMIEYADRHAGRWDAAALDGQSVDMAQEMMRLTMAIVAKTLFDFDVESEADEISEALSSIVGLFERTVHPAAVLLTILPTLKNFRFMRAKKRIDSLIYRMIAERRKSGVDHGDLLSMLLNAQDEDDGSGMSDQQVHDEAVTLFLAGHETTANALSWTWYALSQNPDVEAKFHAEIDDVLGGELPTPHDIPKLEYTRRVFAESMRLYPPAYLIGRMAIDEYQLGDYTLPPKSVILMCPYVCHRNPAQFPDPERFDPDRWTPERQRERHKFSYFPFGGGPRTCIGESFAWMEGVLLLAVFGQRWRMTLRQGHAVGYDPQITLRPKGGLPMTLSRRTTASAARAIA
ncbi:MAG: cytochrome P450 [Candidatus Hydrogenedentes bacterium]|nr:cytochrome P450 [Candidatus Hydrogenedentota bacterium]